MSNYVKTTNFAAKDALASGNPLKVAKGTEINTELDNIATAIATKEDLANKGVANGYVGIDASGNISVTGSGTFTGSVTVGGSVVTGIVNGTSGLSLQTAGVTKVSVNTAGNVTISAPSSGTALTVNGVSGSAPLVVTPASGSQRAITVGNGTIDGYWAFTAGNVMQVGTSGSHGVSLITANSERVAVAAAGNVTLAAPSSGATLTVSANNAANAIVAGNMGIGYDIGLRSSANNLYWSGTADAAIGTTSSGSLWLYAGGGGRVQINSTGNVTVGAPSSGATLALTFASATNGFTFADGTVSGAIGTGGTQLNFGAITNHAIGFATNNTTRVTVTAAGNVVIASPNSGVALDVYGAVGSAQTLIVRSTTNASVYQTFIRNGTSVGDLGSGDGVISGGSSADFGISSRPSGAVVIGTNGGTARVTIASGGNVTINTAASGDELTVAGSVVANVFSGDHIGDGSGLTSLAAAQLTGTVDTARISGSYTGITAIGASATVNGFTVGYRQIPRSTTSGTATTADVAKCIAVSAGLTIPNATFSAGDSLSIYNDSASAVTITQGTSLTLRWGGTTSTGNRTLAARGMCTVWFNSSSEAIITGSGLS